MIQTVGSRTLGFLQAAGRDLGNELRCDKIAGVATAGEREDTCPDVILV